MRVLVTGGSGFIGSHVVDALIGAGMTPRILDLHPSPYHPVDDVECVIGDLLDPECVRAAVAGCGAVVHLAAAADVDDVTRRPVAAEAINTTGTLNILEAAREAGVRVVYGSTIWVYGDSEGLVDETSSLPQPNHLYTATKLAGEMYCSSYAEVYGVQSTVLRFGIPYGPRARPAGVIPIFVRKALAGEPLTIAGGGEQSRRFVYVEDLADGVVRALAPEAAGRTYNLAGEESVSIRDIAERLREVVPGVEIVSVPARPGDFGGVEVSAERAERELGWSPRTPFRDGLVKYMEWHQRAVAAPEVAAPSNAVRATPARRLGRLAAAGRSWVVGVAMLVGLVAYLAAVHAVGVTGGDERTVAVLSVAAVLGYVGTGELARSWRNAVTSWTAALVACVALLLVFVPALRRTANLGSPDVALVLLSLAGGSLSVSLADLAARRRRRDATRTVTA
jgi:UDP-glucose 4-epimerase